MSEEKGVEKELMFCLCSGGCGRMLKDGDMCIICESFKAEMEIRKLQREHAERMKMQSVRRRASEWDWAYLLYVALVLVLGLVGIYLMLMGLQ